MRVFCIKLIYLFYNLKREQIFSQYRSSVQTIRYQKRGLPYLYLLLFLYPHNRDRLLDPAVINCFISAELLQPKNDPISCLTKIIKLIIVYSPYGSQNPQAPYIVSLGLGLSPTYLKQYPKPFNPTTIVHKNGYPEYYYYHNRRTQSIHLLGPLRAIFKINNRQIILYNLYLTTKYYTYINVEIYASVKSIKYIYKYIYKGNNYATLQLIDGDKVSQYLQGYYIGPSKAIQQLFKFPLYKEFPPIIQLAVHLPGKQPIYFQLDQSIEKIQQRLKLSYSILTAFFKYNTEHKDGRNYLY